MLCREQETDMGSNSAVKPHAVCIPYPAQGHINPMLKLAKLLHTHNFHITFVLTDFNYRRLVRSRGPAAVQGLDDFRFETIPDGLPPSDDDSTQDIVALTLSTTKNCLSPFRRLLADLSVSPTSPTVTCIVSDGGMTFTLDAARELGIPEILLWTISASCSLTFLYFRRLIDRGLIPLKDMADVSNGYLETKVDLPGLTKGIRLKDFPTFIRTANAEDIMLNYVLHETERTYMASAVVFNTFEELEQTALPEVEKILPPVYTIGPLDLLARGAVPAGSPLAAINTSLWKEDATCLSWLEGREPGSVVYVNFGSITVVSSEHLAEFAWGLANSGHDFLWVIRPDLVKGPGSAVPQEVLDRSKERGLVVSWCAQEELLLHPAVGVFLTHCGWNSVIESITGGVPVVCWPFFADQQTNCKYACCEWGVGMEMDSNVRRDEVERMIREVMTGDKGREIRRKTAEWKESAAKACGPQGSSVINLSRVIKEVLRH